MPFTPIWLVVGASSGFGQVITLEALSRGHKVVATARRASTIANLKEAGATVLELDVSASEAAVDAKVKEAHGVYGKLTHVINAAGFVLEGTCEEASEKEVFDQFNTNVLGTIRVTHAVIPYLRTQPGSVIANFGSIASWCGYPAASFYNSSKWAISGFTESIAAELAALQITATVIEPGYFRTEFLNAGRRISTAKRLENIYGGTPAEEFRAQLNLVDNKQPGDVKKGGKVIVDVLTRTGLAEGKEVPPRLLLGTDCLEAVRGKCEGTLKLMEDWQSISASTDYVK